MLSRQEEINIHELVPDLLQYKSAHNELRENLLETVLKLIPVEGPCTVIKMTRFFSEIEKNGKVGRVVDFIHKNEPDDQQLLNEWEQHIRSSDSEIEKQIYRKFGFKQAGVARLKDLFRIRDLINWSVFRHTKIYNLARKAGIGDMAFLWIRCSSPNELWAICLRRLKSEPYFNDKEFEILNHFINLFFDLRHAWEHKKNDYSLTEREKEVIYHFVCGLNEDETAKEMKISTRTVNEHWKHIFEKVLYGVKGERNMKIKVLRELGMINLSI